jgi:hypothetical protein
VRTRPRRRAAADRSGRADGADPGARAATVVAGVTAMQLCNALCKLAAGLVAARATRR